MKFNQEEVNQLIRQRRSIFPKDYSGEGVDDGTIQQMLENANWAPSHKLTEPWRFVVFTGDGLRKLAAFQAECYQKVTIADGAICSTARLSFRLMAPRTSRRGSVRPRRGTRWRSRPRAPAPRGRRRAGRRRPGSRRPTARAGCRPSCRARAPPPARRPWRPGCGCRPRRRRRSPG